MIVVDPLSHQMGYHGRLAGQAYGVGMRNGHMWCHMMATNGPEELEKFARRLALRPAWRDGDHYDLTPMKRELAVKLGAVEITSWQIVELTRAQKHNDPLPEWAQETRQLGFIGGGDVWDSGTEWGK